MKKSRINGGKICALALAGALVLSGCAGGSGQKTAGNGGQAAVTESSGGQAAVTESSGGQAAVTESSGGQAAVTESSSGQAAVQKETEPETTAAEVVVDGLTFTQKGRLGICTDKDDARYEQFAEVMEVAEPFALAPGYYQNIVTQGMDQSKETGNIYVSGYFKKEEANPFGIAGNPTAIAVLNAEGKLIGEYVMLNEDGSAFTSHMGGVAVTEDTIFVSGSQTKDEKGKTSYWIAGIPLSELEAEGHHEVIVKDYYQVPVQPSYLNYSNGILWVGNFYHADENSYKAPSTLGKTKADNDDERFGGYLLGYDLTEKGAQRMVPAEGEDYAMPDADKLYATVDRIQGMTMLEDGTIILSRSYGRTANSQLMVHDPAKAVTKKVSLGDVEYDCIMLEKSTCLDKEYTMLPMSEGITVKADGNGREILVLSESGSVIFDGDGTYDTKTGIFRTDYIWKVEVPEME